MSSPDSADLVAVALPDIYIWTGRPGPDEFAGLPGGPAVLLFVDEHGTPVQLLTTQQLRRFVTSRLSEPEDVRRGRTDLAEVVRGVRWRRVYCPFEARWWYYRLVRVLYPREYRRLVSFGPGWFMHVDWAQPIPEIRVSERVWCGPGVWLGPWPTRRACQEAVEGLWDLFDLCRHPDQIRKTPHGTACAYAEMGRCDAPCDGSVPLLAYLARCNAAWLFATGGINEWISAAANRMRQAVARQEYETAGQIKQQLDFARRWQTQWTPSVRPTDELNFLLGLPVTRRRAWKLVLFRQGYLTDGPVVTDRRVGGDAVAWVRAELTRPAEDLPETARMEQTWLVCHLLLHRERDSALVVPLPNLSVADDLAQTITERAAALRSRGGGSAPGSDTAASALEQDAFSGEEPAAEDKSGD